eukprot:gene10301-13847_t
MYFLLKCFLSLALLCIQTGQLHAELLRVDSKEKWNNSVEKYEKGQTILIEAKGNQIWIDWYIKTDANGYSNTFGVPLRYMTNKANLFTLVCCVNQDINTCENIGKGNAMIVQETGFLSCFANDNDFFYWNNKGSIDFDISTQNDQSTTPIEAFKKEL